MKWIVYLASVLGLAILGGVCIHQSHTIESQSKQIKAQGLEIQALSAIQCNSDVPDESPTRLLLKASNGVNINFTADMVKSNELEPWW